MNTRQEALLERFAFTVPPSLITRRPARPRDSARLLVYDRRTKKVAWDIFRNIGRYLPPRALLVLNDTKVIPARLPVRRKTGGRIDLLLLSSGGGRIHALSPKRLREGEKLMIEPRCFLRVLKRDAAGWILEPSFPLTRLRAILRRRGRTPLPPYMADSPLREGERRREYQSVFARSDGSVAAPTASLHFTKPLLKRLQRDGIELATLTLHVGLGTFAPVTGDQLAHGSLHGERYIIPTKTCRALQKAQNEHRPIIAVGTTALRALESAADARGRVARPRGTTTLFIREGYRFRLVDGLITNFHVPRSSLLMLVSTLVGRRMLLSLYARAIRRKMRLFSFGDAMLIR
ncbi:MAG: S-adenosylmethionine:tRNA ribosyltransferase-isomerase [Candidatus Peregrinibacteria bacterium Gr01-1014_25]|nr:MAG: S-adenosylmethionine:tRNA ribosyltransferase-isomerase [Candidatus Peregrinibacteria bacterium Gr01-1014_25]